MGIRDDTATWDAMVQSAERNRKRADQAEEELREIKAKLAAANLRVADLKWAIVCCIDCLNRVTRFTESKTPFDAMSTEIEEVLRMLKEKMDRVSVVDEIGSDNERESQ